MFNRRCVALKRESLAFGVTAQRRLAKLIVGDATGRVVAMPGRREPDSAHPGYPAWRLRRSIISSALQPGQQIRRRQPCRLLVIVVKIDSSQ